MAAIWSRVNTVLLLFVLFTLVGLTALVAGRVEGGPLDPPTPPGPTDSVRLPGVPIATAPYVLSAPGHYYLTRDLSVGGTVIAITINASNVSLDLGGFTIDGDDSVGSYGVYLPGTQTDVRISHGTVRDFQFGLEAGDDTRIRIDAVHAVSNVRGFQLGDGGVLTDCLASANTEAGIHISGGYAVIRNCVVLFNLGDGISVAGDFNLVEESRVFGHSIDVRDAPVFDSSKNTYRDNTLSTVQLKLNGGALAIDNVCSTINNPGGNTVGGADHANLC